MRFFAQIGLTLLFATLFVWACWWAISGLTGWGGALVFWVALLIGGVLAAQVSYLIARRIPEPPRAPRAPRQPEVVWHDDEESGA